MKPLIATLVLALCGAAFAQSAGDMQKFLQDEARTVQAWGTDTTFVAAVKVQNGKRISAEQLQVLEQQWAGGNAAAMVKEVTTGPCADRLRQLVAANPTYRESFVMDDQGAIVCATAKTSDYWQGDEAKWQRAFNGGKGAVFIDRPKLDESAAQRLAQISVPVVDKGKVIGALTVGVALGK